MRKTLYSRAMLGFMIVSMTAFAFSKEAKAYEKENIDMIGYISGVVAIDKSNHQLLVMNEDGSEVVMKINLPLGVDPSPLGVDPSPLGVDPSPLGVDPSPLGVDPSPLGVDPSPLGVDPSPLN